MKSPSKKVEQGHATRDALLRAARELFGTHGYAATSLSAIVNAAGVTKGAFYHHFDDKEAIFRRVFEMVKQELSSTSFIVHLEQEGEGGQQGGRTPVMTLPDQTNAEVWQDLVGRCRGYIALHTDPQVRRIVLIDSRSVLTWEDWREIENEYGVVIIRANLRRVMNRGIIKKLPLNPLATILTGALNEACMLVANAEQGKDALDEAVTIVEQFLEGLRA